MRVVTCDIVRVIDLRAQLLGRALFARNLRSMISLKKNGTKKIARKVAASMPPITPVPDRCARAGARAGRDRERQHAEDERERGHQDRAGSAAAPPRAPRPTSTCPAGASSSANSTIRIAFFAARPISVTRPIWK